ncbi:MAG: hypothetical protein AAF481_18515 [Acidobacteriota bacterium]
MKEFTLRIALGAVAALMFAPGLATAAVGALQTISSGGKEASIVGDRNLSFDFGMDLDAHARFCTEGTMDEMDCSPPVGGLDHAAAGTGLRNSGFGTVSLRGVPSDAKAVLARVFWGRILHRDDDPEADKNIYFEFDGHKLKGRLLGTTDSPCWDEANTFAAYAAAVPLRLLRPDLNGDYGIALFGSETTNGGALFGTEYLPPLDEGASLVLIYSDPSVSTKSRVYLHTGPERLVGRLILDQELDPPLQGTLGFFRHTRIGGDGQRMVPHEAVRPYGTWIGNRERQIALRGPLSKIDATTDWNGDDGNPQNAMWDTQSNYWPSALTPELAPGALAYRLEYWAIFPPAQPEPLDSANGGRTAQPMAAPQTYWVDCVAVVAHVLTAG